MAQLKNTIILGDLSVTGAAHLAKVYTNILNAPTANNGTTYGPGTAGQALVSNGTTIYWGPTIGASINDGTTSTVAYYSGPTTISSSSLVTDGTNLRNIGGYNNSSYAFSAASAIINSWIRTKGATGWYNEDYGGGWYMPNATWVQMYNNKQVKIQSNHATSNTNLSSQLIVSSLGYNAADTTAGNAVGIELWRGAYASWQIVNDSGNLIFRGNYTTSKQTTYSQQSIYLSYNTGILNAKDTVPQATNTYNLGSESLRWKALYIGTANSYGSANKPVWWNNGVPEMITYELKATVNAATQWGVAYYSTTTNITSTAAGTAGYPLIGQGAAAPTWFGGQVNTGTGTGTWITAFKGTTDATGAAAAAVTVAGGLGVTKTLWVTDGVRIIKNAAASQTAADAILYIENKNADDWAFKIEKDTYNQGILVQGTGDDLLKVGTNDVLHVNDDTTAANRRVFVKGRLELQRKTDNSYGRISFYDSAYYTWINYMSNSVEGAAPTGGQPSTTTEVSSWALRSLIENVAGYGWIWEAASNAVASATSTKPTARMSLSSNTGRLRIEANAATATNNESALIVSSELNGSSGNTAIELWRGGNASWQIINSDGTLYFRHNYITSKQTTYQTQGQVAIAYNTGNVRIYSTTDSNYAVDTGALQVDGGASFAKKVVIADTTDANYSTTSGAGALVVAGGAHFSKKIFLNDTTDSNYATNVQGSFVTMGGVFITKKAYIDDKTDSNYGTLAGALVVAGGANFGKKVYLKDTTDSNYSTKAGSLVTEGGLYVAKKAYIADATDSSSYTTGSLVTAGGVAVTKQLRVQGVTTHGGNVVSDTNDTDSIGITGTRWKSAYFSASILVGSTNYTSTTSAYAGTSIGVGCIELSGASSTGTPYIDFHYGGSTADYTSRIIASGSGILKFDCTTPASNTSYNSRSIAAKFFLNGITYCSSNVEAAGYFLQNVASAGGGYYVYGANNQYGRMYISTIGTAGTATTYDDGNGNTVTGYTGNTAGVVTLVLGNNKAVGTNGSSYSSPGTAGNAHNAYGCIALYASNSYYTRIRSQGNGNRTFFLPNYGGDMYAVHIGNNSAVGGATTPTYVAANGRVTACTAYGSANVLSATKVGVAAIWLYPNNSNEINFGGTYTGNTNIYIGYRSMDSRPIPTCFYFGGSTGTATIRAASVYGAVWNDYAEFRIADTKEPGRVIKETPTGEMTLTTQRLEKGCEIISDTYGFAIGEDSKAKTPTAATGRVLAYTDKPRETFELGMPVCSGPDGTVSQMTEEEARMYPWCIIGTVSEIPTYEEWGTGKVKVNGRIWIRIR